MIQYGQETLPTALQKWGMKPEGWASTSFTRFTGLHSKRNLILIFLGVLISSTFLVNRLDFAHDRANLPDSLDSIDPQVTPEDDQQQQSSLPRGIVEDDYCSSAPRGRNVMVSLKTGASELHIKLPTHLLTLTNCMPKDQLILFSDRDETFAGWPVYDALANVSSSWKKEHEDFITYNNIEAYRWGGLQPDKLSGGRSWFLDKWKFMPLAFKTWESAPEHVEWFFFMEADTAVSWLNLLTWLEKLDPSKPHFRGLAITYNDGGKESILHAHGGSGYLVSRPALEALVKKRQSEGPKKYDRRWEHHMTKTCCGDIAFAVAMKEVGIPVVSAGGMLQRETINTVSFSKQMWCQSPITQHHVGPYQVNDLWRFQTSFVKEQGNWDRAYTWRDLYNKIVRDAIKHPLEDWDNLRADIRYEAPKAPKANEKPDERWEKYNAVEKASVKSASNCAEACDYVKDCLQWRWIPGKCMLGTGLVFGIASEESAAEWWTSGWHQNRVEQVVESWGTCS